MPDDARYMVRAIELAQRGQGQVEPNPMVGCVLVKNDAVVGEGWHPFFGGPHAEVEALGHAGERARGATAYVTLEPCCHFGRTPPCTGALIDAQVARVVVALRDPFPQVAGDGIAQLQAAGISVSVGVLEVEARELNAPYLKLLAAGRPWILAKWAMSLDGKIATHSGSSQWISSDASRNVVHALRGRVDAIIVGRRTAQLDDPLLTARPPGPRTATRIVIDSTAALSPTSRLVQTVAQAPVLVAVGDDALADADRCERLTAAGCEVFRCAGATHAERLLSLLDELGRRRFTNVLVEGGGQLLGALFDLHQIDEVHAFIAPKLVGGATAPTPLAGAGIAKIPSAPQLHRLHVERFQNDLYLTGRVP